MTSNKPQLSYAIGDSLYLNISNRCTLRCEFCPKTHDDFSLHEFDLRLNKQPSSEQILSSLPKLDDFKEIVFCGFGESTLRLRQLKEIALFIKSKGLKTRLNTDGLANLVHKRNVLPELSQSIDALSISLNADTEEAYIRHCQPQLEQSYQAVLTFIKQAPKHIENVRVTAISGLDGVSIENCQQIAFDAGATFLARKLDILG